MFLCRSDFNRHLLYVLIMMASDDRVDWCNSCLCIFVEGRYVKPHMQRLIVGRFKSEVKAAISSRLCVNFLGGKWQSCGFGAWNVLGRERWVVCVKLSVHLYKGLTPWLDGMTVDVVPVLNWLHWYNIILCWNGLCQNFAHPTFTHYLTHHTNLPSSMTTTTAPNANVLKLTEPAKDLLPGVDVFIFDCDGVIWRVSV